MNAKEILTNWIVKNVALAVAIVIVLAIGANLFLGLVTKHGKSIEVPDMTNMTVAEAQQTAHAAGLKAEVYDSVYVRRMTRGAVFSQNPAPGAHVKDGRRVILTINAKNAKKVTMPDLVGCSLRQARAELTSKGLILRKIIYKSDMATDNVLAQQYKGSNIRKGTQIDSGSGIDLVVGLNDEEGSQDVQTYVPNLLGMKYMRATDALHDNSLNVTALFDKSVTNYSDSLDAVVYKQGIEPSDAPILKGESISIYLSVDPEKANK